MSSEITGAFDLLLYAASASEHLDVQSPGLQMLLRVMLLSLVPGAQANTRVLHVESIECTSKHLLDVGTVEGT